MRSPSNAHQQNYKARPPAARPEDAGATPIYELLDEKGPDHSKCFEVVRQHRRPPLHQRLGPTKRWPSRRPRCWRWKNWASSMPKEVDEAIEAIVVEERRRSDVLSSSPSG